MTLLFIIVVTNRVCASLISHDIIVLSRETFSRKCRPKIRSTFNPQRFVPQDRAKPFVIKSPSVDLRTYSVTFYPFSTYFLSGIPTTNTTFRTIQHLYTIIVRHFILFFILVFATYHMWKIKTYILSHNHYDDGFLNRMTTSYVRQEINFTQL